VISAAGERPRLEACEYHACSEASELEHSLGFALKANGLEGTKCVCLPRPGVYSLRQIETPPVKGEELREAARWSVKDLVDFDIESAVVDVFDVPQSEAGDRPQRLYVVAARRSLIDDSVSLIRRVGLRLEAIDILELALRNVSTLLPQEEAGVALMYLGPDVSLLTITRGGWLYLARNIDADLEVLSTNPAFDPEDQKPEDFEESKSCRRTRSSIPKIKSPTTSRKPP
jgi:MSHA biogenesis protein MshI